MPYFTSFGYPGKVHAAHHEEAVLELGYRRVKGSWAQCVGRKESWACLAMSLVPGLVPPRGGKSTGVTAAPFPPPTPLLPGGDKEPPSLSPAPSGPFSLWPHILGSPSH